MFQLSHDLGDHSSGFIFSSLTESNRYFIISRGPHRPDYDNVRKTVDIKPRQQSRYFQKRWYHEFYWLEYSVVDNSLFCFPCRLFTSQTGNSKTTFTKDGSTDFKNADNNLRKHVASEGHLFAYARWKEYRSNFMLGCSISSKLSK